MPPKLAPDVIHCSLAVDSKHSKDRCIFSMCFRITLSESHDSDPPTQPHELAMHHGICRGSMRTARRLSAAFVLMPQQRAHCINAALRQFAELPSSREDLFVLRVLLRWLRSPSAHTELVVVLHKTSFSCASCRSNFVPKRLRTVLHAEVGQRTIYDTGALRDFSRRLPTWNWNWKRSLLKTDAIVMRARAVEKRKYNVILRWMRSKVMALSTVQKAKTLDCQW